METSTNRVQVALCRLFKRVGRKAENVMGGFPITFPSA